MKERNCFVQNFVRFFGFAEAKVLIFQLLKSINYRFFKKDRNSSLGNFTYPIFFTNSSANSLVFSKVASFINL